MSGMIAQRQVANVELALLLVLLGSSPTSAQQPSAGRQVAGEIELYRRYGPGVVRVQAGLSTGTGFFIAAPERLILTNEHVLVGGPPVSVILNGGLRVSAQVVATDPGADLAILRVHPSLCVECPRLSLANLDELEREVVPGERVVALGYPLHQPLTLTAGIVTAVLERALISDLNVNPGNSGGPMLNLAGQVVGVNTFAEQGAVGPGLAGAVRIDQARDVLARAQAALPTLELPSTEALPVLDQTSYPLEALRDLADSVLERSGTPYHAYIGLPAVNFHVHVLTPAAQYVRRALLERRATHVRQEPGVIIDTTNAGRYMGFEPRHDWVQHVGGLTSPGVLLTVTPVPRQRGCGYEGDLYDLTVHRNGRAVTPVVGGTTALALLCDVAFEGLYVLRPEVFAPGPGQLPPRITLLLNDLKEPADRRVYPVELPANVVAQVWNDFGPYYASRGMSVTAARADVLPFSEGSFFFKGADTPWIAEQVVSDVLAEHGFRVDEVVPGDRVATWYVTRLGTADEARVYLQRARLGEYFFAVWSDRQDWREELTNAIRGRFPGN